MELSIRELNELIYCIDVARKHGQLLGTTVADTLAIKLRDELDERLKPDYITESLKQAAKRYGDEVRVKRIHIEEDTFIKVLKSNESEKERGWITQAMLDYVDSNGAATFTQMNDFYQYITKGSNSFTHILQSLKTPYKNRKTQRYLAKEGKRGSNAKWVVKVANPSNWVVVND